MTDAEIKSLMREKGCCGEVFTDERGVRVTCLLTWEHHHAENIVLKADLAKTIAWMRRVKAPHAARLLPQRRPAD
jgi:hypothetical protein